MSFSETTIATPKSGSTLTTSGEKVSEEEVETTFGKTDAPTGSGKWVL